MGEDRIRNYDIFYNSETGDRIPPYLIHEHDNVSIRPSNYTIQSLKDQNFMKMRKVQRLILNKHWIKNWGVKTPNYDEMIQETLEELSATIC